MNEKPPSPLRRAVFRNLWIAALVSGIGSAMHDTATAWTMTQLTDSALLISLATALIAAPFFLFSAPAGALADLVDRRRFLIVAQGWMMLVAGGLAGWAWFGELSPFVLLLATFLIGVGLAFNQPAWISIMPDLVPKPEMPAAVTLGSVSLNISRAAGPALAGIILAATSPAVVFAFNAVTFVAIIFVLWRWKPEARRQPARAERFTGALRAGFRYAAHSPAMRTVLLRTFAFAFFGIACLSLLPVLATRRLQLPAAEFGWLMSSFGVSAVFTAFVLLPLLRARFKPDTLLTGASITLALALAGLAVVPSFVPALALVALGSGAWLTAFSTLNVAGQLSMPTWSRGRMNSIYVMIMQAAQMLGAVAAGQVASWGGLTLALGLSAAGLALTTLLGFRYALALPHSIDLDAAPTLGAHNFPASPAEEDGPVLISIDYRIDPARHAEFVRAMDALRLHRRRDGAMRWLLSQDLEDPTQFREEFLVASWAEHMRQHERAVREDASIENAALAFHVDATAPRVRHLLATALPR